MAGLGGGVVEEKVFKKSSNTFNFQNDKVL